MEYQKKISIHLRNLSKADNILIEEVLKETGEKTYSKAMLSAFADFLLYKRRYKDLEGRFIRLVEKHSKD